MAGYKGWLFYSPDTKKYYIGETAEFDERYFPGTVKTANWTPPGPVDISADPSVSSPAPELPELVTLPMPEPEGEYIPAPLPQPEPEPDLLSPLPSPVLPEAFVLPEVPALPEPPVLFPQGCGQ